MRVVSFILPILASLAVVASATPVSNAAKTHLTKRALGDFFYTYTDANGVEHRQKLSGPNDLPNRECRNVPEAEDPDTTKPAHSPRNNSDMKVYVFEDIDCDGTYQVLALGGGEGGINLKFRSFLFDV